MTYIEALRPRTEPSTSTQGRDPRGGGGNEGTARPIPKDTVTVSARAVAAANEGSTPPKVTDRLEDILGGRPLSPADIGLCLSMNRIDAAVQVAARLAGVPTAAAVNAYQNGDVGRALSQLASVGVDSGTASWLLRGMGRTVMPSPAETARAQAASSAYASVARSTDDVTANDDADDAEHEERVDFRI